MTNGNGSTISVEKRAEFFRDFIQSVLSLAAGSIVFSVTFLHDVLRIGDAAPGRTQMALRHPVWLVTAWIILLLSVIASLVYLYVHAVSTKYESAYSNFLARVAEIACASFAVGLILLVVFGFLNLPI